MESYNPHHEIVHQHIFTDIFLLEDQELIIETFELSGHILRAKVEFFLDNIFIFLV
ncbi:hypothetical protein NC651_037855 [Populus alba x Populus x berolinensis]|nr:hypothetical protein NC651_037855 [Populus alba x Populus x berolinensis]